MPVAALRMRALDHMGHLSNDATLRDAGFSPGMGVVRKSDDTHGIIKSMTATTVHVTIDGKEMAASAESFLNREWKAWKAPAGPKTAEDWLTKTRTCSTEMFIVAIKGRVIHLLCAESSMLKDLKGKAGVSLCGQIS